MQASWCNFLCPAAVAMAEAHTDIVVGVVSRGHVASATNLLHMTPGVKLEGGGDSLGQQYLTPEQVCISAF